MLPAEFKLYLLYSLTVSDAAARAENWPRACVQVVEEVERREERAAELRRRIRVLATG